MSLESMARVHLAHLPTPLDDAPRLSALLGGPRILVKRDDMTGLAFGGNKTRKLEYLMGDAMRQGADTIFTSGAPQSNHCRQTAAAAARLGLRLDTRRAQRHAGQPAARSPAQGRNRLHRK